MGERPGKVTAAAVILLIGAVLGVAAAVFVTYMGLGGFSLSPDPETRRLQWLLVGGSAIAVALAAGQLILGIKLLQGRRWARFASIGLMVFSILSTVVPWELAIVPEAGYEAPNCLALILPVVVIALLNSADARHFFAEPIEQPQAVSDVPAMREPPAGTA